MEAKTLFEKVWEKHIITSFNSEASLVFIDLHLVHEVTSPQAFDSLRSEHIELKDELEQAQEKMMEYKLKFDYAQKQLQSDS